MKVLLDECVNARLARHMSGHEVSTVARMGWLGVSNGALLSRATTAGFRVFLTLDKSLSFQNHLPSYPIAVVVMRARSNALADLLRLIPQVMISLENTVAGTVTFVGS